MDSPYEITYERKSFIQTFRVGEKRVDPLKLYRCSASEDLQRIARGIYAGLDADKEHFLVLCMNNKNRVTGHKVISTGSLTASLVHPREVFTAVLYMHAAAIAFVHNHPSGDPAPSPEDIDITKRLKEVAEIIGIRLLDHVVLGNDRYFSFSDKGIL